MTLKIEKTMVYAYFHILLICFGLVLFGFLGLEDRNFGIQYYTHLC